MISARCVEILLRVFAATIRVSRSEGNARLLLALTLLATGCGSLLSAQPACELHPALVASDVGEDLAAARLSKAFFLEIDW